jgi:hypothetical protein
MSLTNKPELPVQQAKWQAFVGILISTQKLHCLLVRQLLSHRVSSGSLQKTGIFADMAGDFRQLPPRDHQFGRLETKPNARKSPIWRAFLIERKIFSGKRNA